MGKDGTGNLKTKAVCCGPVRKKMAGETVSLGFKDRPFCPLFLSGIWIYSALVVGAESAAERIAQGVRVDNRGLFLWAGKHRPRTSSVTDEMRTKE